MQLAAETIAARAGAASWRPSAFTLTPPVRKRRPGHSEAGADLVNNRVN